MLLICDVDGVLYHYDRDLRVATLAAAVDRPPEAVRAALYDSGIEDAGDAGALSAEDYLAALGDELGVPVPREAWVRARAAASTPDIDVLRLVAGIAQRVPVAALSNNGTLLKEEAPRILPELAAMHDVTLFVGGEIGAAKPDAAAFLAVCRAYRTAPEETILVDDSPEYVDGARAAGLRGHVFTDLPTLEAFLRTCTLL